MEVPIAATPAPETEEPTPETDRAPAAPGDVYHENCTAARDASAAPVHRGDPGYATHLDSEGDGIGCG
ncbi:excalibur calcium-binding domain-containing protein [Arthrobacter sp. H14]|uniref:excalibur calcium-binding domain-containing protein n=1 Tax=Arthrobacter sp. H14 TaxID=1312959 RepID=UPI000479D4AD|nr:excalibur calcium-binding domain-containing protein [Arthrobacter sp. H14]